MEFPRGVLGRPWRSIGGSSSELGRPQPGFWRSLVLGRCQGKLQEGVAGTEDMEGVLAVSGGLPGKSLGRLWSSSVVLGYDLGGEHFHLSSIVSCCCEVSCCCILVFVSFK